MNSKRKGKRLELELCKVLREMGYKARRSEQYQGKTGDSADLQTDIPNVRVECKGGYNNCELWHKKIQEWIDQADAECASTGERWVIFWRKDRGQWTALVRMGGVVVHTLALQEAIEWARYEAAQAA